MKLVKLAVLSLFALCLSGPAFAGPGSGGGQQVVADFNGDGRADLLTVDSNGLLFVFITDTDGVSVDNAASGAPATLPVGFSVVDAADFNGDGRADVLVRDGSGLLFVFITDTDGISFDLGASGAPTSLSSDFQVVACNDFDGDGNADILVQNTTTGLLFVFVLNADGISINNAASGAPSTLSASFAVRSAADYNGDGRADLLVEDVSGGASDGLLFIFITAVGGISFDNGASGALTTIASDFSYVGSGDFTGDMGGPRADVMVVSDMGLAFVFVVDSSGVAVDNGASGAPFSTPGTFAINGIGDFNGDGKTDSLLEDATKLVFIFIHDDAATVNNGASGSPVTFPGTFDLAGFVGL